MKLFVCWGTFPVPARPGGHPCRNAYVALQEAGHDPEVERVYGLGALPDALNGPRRREIKMLTGQSWVPVLVLDDGEIVQGSKQIVAWAQSHPAA
ncbi:MAG TPA: glutathione S-transferase N-terminal domain-containing protein [Solirubrobacteraceae bacterium]